jgi:hypothetical protein
MWLHELKDGLIDIIHKDPSVLLLCKQGVFLSLDKTSGEIVRCARIKNGKFRKFLRLEGSIIAQCENGEEYDVAKA